MLKYSNTDMIEAIEHFAQTQPDFPSTTSSIVFSYSMRSKDLHWQPRLKEAGAGSGSPVVVYWWSEYEMLATGFDQKHKYSSIDSHSALKRDCYFWK